MNYRSVRSIAAFGVMVIGIGSVGSKVEAQSITTLPGGSALAGASYVNFDEVALGAGASSALARNGAGGIIGSIGLTFAPDAQVVSGDQSGLYAAPFLSGANDLHFENSLGSGPDGTHYLTGGGAGGAATLTFGGANHYVGLLWGSVDTYNTLTFLDHGSSVGSVTGSQVLASPNGDQGVNGTVYVNITTSFAFDAITINGTQHAFEFDNVAYAVPEPASLAMSGIAALVVSGVALRRRKAGVA